MSMVNQKGGKCEMMFMNLKTRMLLDVSLRKYPGNLRDISVIEMVVVFVDNSRLSLKSW